ncbi:hypothetical protein ACSSV1_005576 [Labrenzia sp. MBR-25]|jgi:hypothetical protein
MKTLMVRAIYPIAFEDIVEHLAYLRRSAI